MGRGGLAGPWVNEGSSPQLNKLSTRAPLSGRLRTTAAACVGATFQLGAAFGRGSVMAKRRASCSSGRVLANLPHMMQSLS
jgi:hypothetical protein